MQAKGRRELQRKARCAPQSARTRPKRESAVKQGVKGSQLGAHIVAEDFFGQDFAELHAFLVEGVEIPQEALKHDFVLKVGEQGAEGARCQSAAVNEARVAVPGKPFVGIVVIFSESESGDLRGEVGVEFSLIGAAVD